MSTYLSICIYLIFICLSSFSITHNYFTSIPSGQTFPALHATRKLSRLVGNRLWLLVGCFGSKMEQAMVESYREMVRVPRSETACVCIFACLVPLIDLCVYVCIYVRTILSAVLHLYFLIIVTSKFQPQLSVIFHSITVYNADTCWLIYNADKLIFLNYTTLYCTVPYHTTAHPIRSR